MTAQQQLDSFASTCAYIPAKLHYHSPLTSVLPDSKTPPAAKAELPSAGPMKVLPVEPTIRLVADNPLGKPPAEKAAETWLLI